MPYHFPIKKGDRVALAPHHDLWMAGCRFGTVTSVGGEGSMGGRFYFVDLDTGRNVTLLESDLLGAVRHPSGASYADVAEQMQADVDEVTGATSSTCSACGATLVVEDCPNYGDGPEHN